MVQLVSFQMDSSVQSQCSGPDSFNKKKERRKAKRRRFCSYSHICNESSLSEVEDYIFSKAKSTTRRQ